MQYKFKYKRKFFWKTIEAKGHGYDQSTDRMTVYKLDGEILVIPKFSECHMYLGKDWVISTQQQMSKEAGTEVAVDVKSKGEYA